MNWTIILELIKLETRNLSQMDQFMYGLALMSPFAGLFTAWFVAVGLRGWLKALVALVLPLIWTGGMGYLLFSIPATGVRLLLVSYGLSVAVTGIHFISALILIIAYLLDAAKAFLGQRFTGFNKSEPRVKYPYVVVQGA